MNLLFLINKNFIQSKSGGNFFSLISIITFSGIALGVAILIVTLTILDGFNNIVKEKILDFNSHIIITGFHRQNLSPPNVMNPFFEKHLSKNLVSVSPNISKAVIVKVGNKSEGIILNGIDLNNDNTNIKFHILEGNYSFKLDQSEGLIIGKKLATKLNAKVGDKMTIFALANDKLPSYENPAAIYQFLISGIYESGMAEYDDLIAYCDINFANSFFDMKNQVSGYNIKLNDLSKIDSLSNVLTDHLRHPFYVRSFSQLHPQIFTWLELQKKPIPIILGLITLIAVFNIVGTLLMIVIEKTKQIGVLKTLGLNQSKISKIFIIQGLVLASIGILIGNFLALTFSLLQKHFNIISLPDTVYFLSSVPITIDLYHYILVDSITLILAFFAAYIPSRIAGKTNPISSIKFN